MELKTFDELFKEYAEFQKKALITILESPKEGFWNLDWFFKRGRECLYDTYSSRVANYFKLLGKGANKSRLLNSSSGLAGILWGRLRGIESLAVIEVYSELFQEPLPAEPRYDKLDENVFRVVEEEKEILKKSPEVIRTYGLDSIKEADDLLIYHMTKNKKIKSLLAKL